VSALAAGMGVALALTGAALYFTGQAYLGERDQRVQLEFAKQLSDQATAFKEEKEGALASLRLEYDGKIHTLETSIKETTNDFTAQLLSARQDALQKPMAFGDDLIRDFIRLDCLWSAGEASASLSGRSACRREAEAADPSSAGFSFAVITPDFLAAWGDACEDWLRVGTGTGDLAYFIEDWEGEYGNFDPMLCYDSLVAMTPEFSVFLRTFLANGEGYTAALLNNAIERGEIIDILTKP